MAVSSQSFAPDSLVGAHRRDRLALASGACCV